MCKQVNNFEKRQMSTISPAGWHHNGELAANSCQSTRWILLINYTLLNIFQEWKFSHGISFFRVQSRNWTSLAYLPPVLCSRGNTSIVSQMISASWVVMRLYLIAVGCLLCCLLLRTLVFLDLAMVSKQIYI